MIEEKALIEAVKIVWSGDEAFAENLDKARNTYLPIEKRRKALRELVEMNWRKREMDVAISEMKIQWSKQAIESLKIGVELLKELRETPKNAWAQRENIVYNLGWVDSQIDLCNKNAGSTLAEATKELYEHKAQIVLIAELQAISEQINDRQAYEEFNAQLVMLTKSLPDVQRSFNAVMEMVKLKEAKK
jgi:hypothetical protein